MLRHPNLTHKRLKQVLHYDPETGVFTRLEDRNGNNAQAGARAGCLKKHGYRTINIDGHRYYEHDLCALYMSGSFLDKMGGVVTDHINGVRDDNRWANLRAASCGQNCANRKMNKTNAVGLKSVKCHSNKNRSKRYGASIKINYKSHHLGWFVTPEEANAAYCAAAKSNFADFSRTE